MACDSRTDRYDVQLLSTEDPARTREDLLRAGRALRCPIAIGGDYTINEMAAVAMELQVPLLPVPAGSGNIFARTFGYHATVPSVPELLEHRAVRHIDAGHVERSLFLANHAYGLIEDVKHAIETAPALPRQRLRRYLHYWWAAARSVCTVPAMPRVRLVALLLAFLVRAPGCWRDVWCRRAARVRVTTAGGVQHRLCVLPGAVPVLLLPAAGSVSPHMRLAS